MDFRFSLYQPKKYRTNQNLEPIINITQHGRLFFNKAALKLLSERKYCKLGFDWENQAIGILPVDNYELNCFPIRYTVKGAYIGAKKFFKHFNTLPAETLEIMPTQAGEFIGLKL